MATKGKATVELLQSFLTKPVGFHKVLAKVKVLEAGDGVCLAEMKVSEEHTNPIGSLHGGLMATLVDSLTTGALVTHKNCGFLQNVSVDIHMTYLKGVNVGDDILIDAKTYRVGKTLAFLKCEITNKATGEIVAKGSHTKFIVRPT